MEEKLAGLVGKIEEMDTSEEEINVKSEKNCRHKISIKSEQMYE